MVSCLRLMNLAFNKVSIYPPSHPEVVDALAKLHAVVNPLVIEMEDIGFGFMDEMLYLEGAMSLEETANNQTLVDRFTKCRVKYLTIANGVTRDELGVFFQVLNAEVTKPTGKRPGETLEERGVQTIHLVEAEPEDLAGRKLGRKKTLLDWYEKAVNTYKGVVDQFRRGQPVDFKLLYRHIDDMTATIKNKGCEPYLLLPAMGRGLDPHACHSVNVSILACALGDAYGLNSGQTNTLSMAAFMHDLGRLVIPPAWLAQKKPLSPAEQAGARQHALWGELLLLSRKELPPQAAVLAGRHHMQAWPPPKTGYIPDVFHRIFAAADHYDLGFIGEKYYWNRHRPDRVLRRMLNRRGTQFDPAILKLLANCVGYYPPGTLVLLKDGRRGIVVRPSPVHPARPKVYLYAEDKIPETPPPPPEDGTAPPDEPPPPVLDLAEPDEKGLGFRNSVVSTLSSAGKVDIQKVLLRRREHLLSYQLK